MALCSLWGSSQTEIQNIEIRSSKESDEAQRLWAEDQQQLSHSFTSRKHYENQKCQRVCKTIENCLVEKEKETLLYFLFRSFLKPCDLYTY